ncbi:RNase P modulator RnpM [uncultured Finegoldia sp.]|uniref:RNase P modulator RnpM n=1 Tax=uncultured Finegoldia sp. TaxID=328009 RepID=UPI002626CE35|nr:YlxR family protein [uncultured Finegoldia sp.]
MKTKKIPLRKCVVCGENKPKENLMRVVFNKEDGISVDLTNKKNGRGAYVCKNKDCVDKAKKSKRLNQVLKANVDTQIYEELLNHVED